MKGKAIYPGMAALLGATLLLGGCTHKKSKYQPPVAPQLVQADSWKTTPAGGETSKPADDETLSHWWSVFNDPILTSLEERALKSNLDLKTAEAGIRQARASRESASSSLFPTVTGSLSTMVSHSSSGGSSGYTGAGGMVTSGSNNGAISASWEPDFFGSIRNNVAASDATLQSKQENLRYAMVTLTAELALDYIDVRTYQAQLAITKSNLVKYQETYEMTKQKEESGLATTLEVQQALGTVASTQAEIPSLEANLQKAYNAISVLLAQKPGSVDAELTAVKSVPTIPSEVAIGIPADLIRRRPDIRAAERQYASQWHQVKVAKANLWPTFSLSGSFTSNANSFGNVFTPTASAVSSIAGSVQQTLLNRRALKAQLHLQNAMLDQYEISYESTVLSAIQDVENALKALSAEQERRKSLVVAADAAEQSLEMSRSLYAAGQKDFLTVLDSERSVLNTQNNLIQSDANISADLIRLYKAMGGGWKQ
jgi:NodT family efflux transporter outer membrane factor (OMF) lipoprotein